MRTRKVADSKNVKPDESKFPAGEKDTKTINEVMLYVIEDDYVTEWIFKVGPRDSRMQRPQGDISLVQEVNTTRRW